MNVCYRTRRDRKLRAEAMVYRYWEETGAEQVLELGRADVFA